MILLTLNQKKEEEINEEKTILRGIQYPQPQQDLS